MDAARDRLAAAGCSVLVVTQAKPEILSFYLGRQTWVVPVVADPDRAAYRAFGLERIGWLTFFRPGVLWGYLRKMFAGYGVKKPYPGEDVLQLGGDFVLNRNRVVVYAYPSADPTDRPSVDALLGAIRTASSAGTIPPEPLPDRKRIDADPAGT